MKLIIDIPEHFYEVCKADEDAIEIRLAVKNGIPLDTVLRCRDCKYASIHCTQYNVDVDALDGCSNWEGDD